MITCQMEIDELFAARASTPTEDSSQDAPTNSCTQILVSMTPPAKLDDSIWSDLESTMHWMLEE
jgi:hypothetical protein